MVYKQFVRSSSYYYVFIAGIGNDSSGIVELLFSILVRMLYIRTCVVVVLYRVKLMEVKNKSKMIKPHSSIPDVS